MSDVIVMLSSQIDNQSKNLETFSARKFQQFVISDE